MAVVEHPAVPLQHADQFFIGGEWVKPSTDSTFDVIDSTTELTYFTVAEAQAADMDRAVAAAKLAFDEGPWPRMSHAERAGYMRALSKELQARVDVLVDTLVGPLYHRLLITGEPINAEVADEIVELVLCGATRE